jgi:hypothetical protein
MACKNIPIDWNLVDKLIQCGNDGVRVAANLGIHPDTLYNRCKAEHGSDYSAYQAEKRAKGVSLLLAKQYEVAMKGNTTMLIWVGKQMAGQKEQFSAATNITFKEIDPTNDNKENRDSSTPQISDEILSE